MYAILAFLPILFIIIGMAVINKPAKIILPIALILSIIIAFIFWHISIANIAIYSLYGFLKSFEVLFIIFGAILLLNVLKISGGLYAINSMFSDISNDKRVQLIIIGLLFEAFMEAVAGFGAPAALAAPILIGLGFPAFFAAFSALIFDTIPVSFGAVGAPILATINALSLNLDSLSILEQNNFISGFVSKIVLINLLTGFIIPILVMFIMIFFFGKKGDSKIKSFIDIIPFVIYSSILLFGISFLVAKVSYELPSLIASSISLLIVIFTTKKYKLFIPKTEWNFLTKHQWKEDWNSSINIKQVQMQDRGISIFKALFPYILIGLILLITRIEVFHLKGIINSAVIPFEWLFTILGSNLKYDFQYAYNPGIVPFILVSALIIFIHKLSVKEYISAWSQSLKQVKDSTISLLSVFAMIQIMLYSTYNNIDGLDGMLTEIAKDIAMIAGEYFIIASPFIGILGTFFGGSAAVSNILFSSLQYETALLVDLNKELIIALQIIGASLGNMISINKIIAVSITAGLVGVEGKIIRMNFIPILIYTPILLLCVYILFL